MDPEERAGPATGAEDPAGRALEPRPETSEEALVGFSESLREVAPRMAGLPRRPSAGYEVPPLDEVRAPEETPVGFPEVVRADAPPLPRLRGASGEAAEEATPEEIALGFPELVREDADRVSAEAPLTVGSRLPTSDLPESLVRIRARWALEAPLNAEANRLRTVLERTFLVLLALLVGGLVVIGYSGFLLLSPAPWVLKAMQIADTVVTLSALGLAAWLVAGSGLGWRLWRKRRRILDAPPPG